MKKFSFFCILLLVITNIMWTCPQAKATGLNREAFVHPGILNSQADLVRMKTYAVGEQACEPWSSAYAELLELVNSYYDETSSKYIDFDDLTTTVITHENSGGGNDMRVAASKAYNLAIAYHISDNTQYAQTAKEIMMHYADQFQGLGSTIDGHGLYDCEVISGVIAEKFCSAAEILIYRNYSGWTNAETQRLIGMFQANAGANTICSMARLFDWTNDDDGLMSEYDMDNLAHGHATFTNFGALAYAVFAGDVDLYNTTVSNLTANVSPEYSEGVYSWERKPKVIGTGGAFTYNINPVTGQNKEIDRDMTHSTVLISGLVTAAQIAYNQGNPQLYECHERLLLKGIDYVAKYNLGYDVAYTNVYPWNHHNDALTTDNRGGAILENPMFEAAYNYYKYHSTANDSEYLYLEELVNNCTLSPESISEDVAGMGTLMYSDLARKTVYESCNDTENPQDTILAENYMALVKNAEFMENNSIQVSGGQKGIITYRSPNWQFDGEETTELGISFSSTTSGYIEIRMQSKDGNLFGQPLASQLEAGNTGSILGRIAIPDTEGQQRTLKCTIYNNSGTLGGKIVNREHAEMLFVVIYGYDANGSIQLDEIQLRPDDTVELANDAITYPERPIPSDYVPIAMSEANVYKYGWNGSGMGVAEVNYPELFDGNLSNYISDSDGNPLSSDQYLIIDLGDTADIDLIDLGIHDTNILGANWSVYGATGNSIPLEETNWTVLAESSSLMVDDWNVASINISDGPYRYLMIGGNQIFLNSWIHSWDKFSDIQLYRHESGMEAPANMTQINVSDITFYTYGWNGSGIGFSNYVLNGAFDGNTVNPLTDFNANSVAGMKDVYLILDLGNTIDLSCIKFASQYDNLFSGSWAIYGSTQLSTNQSDWNLISVSSDMSSNQNITKILCDDSVRYLMIGGYSDNNFMNTWIHCWDYFTEIGLYQINS